MFSIIGCVFHQSAGNVPSAIRPISIGHRQISAKFTLWIHSVTNTEKLTRRMFTLPACYSFVGQLSSEELRNSTSHQQAGRTVTNSRFEGPTRFVIVHNSLCIFDEQQHSMLTLDGLDASLFSCLIFPHKQMPLLLTCKHRRFPPRYEQTLFNKEFVGSVSEYGGQKKHSEQISPIRFC